MRPISPGLKVLLVLVASTSTSAQSATSCPYSFGNPIPIPTTVNGTSNCVPDLLLDDFNISNASHPTNGESGPAREAPNNITGAVYYNWNGGDYGEAAAPFTVTNGSMTITAMSDPSVDGEFASHPGTAATYNYWFSKYNPCACFDASKYSSLVMEFSADPSMDFNITYTQHSPNCTTRLIDAVYRLLTHYLQPNGTIQTLVLPFNDFTSNLIGSPYDLAHIKDLTLVNMHPVGANMTIYKMYLSSKCGSNITSVSQSPSGSSTNATSSPASSNAYARFETNSSILGASTVLALFLVALFL